MATEYDLKKSLPNKMVNENNTITDLAGNPVTNAAIEYENKPALPNKWLNPDGTYSTLAEILSGMIDTDLFIVVEELPASGNVNKIYLLADGDILKEYHWTGTKWDPIGMVEFDLSQYSTTDEMNAAILAALNQAKAYADDNFLKKNNTTAYTPTGDYNPATKKYVDDKINGTSVFLSYSAISDLTEESTMEEIYEAFGGEDFFKDMVFNKFANKASLYFYDNLNGEVEGMMSYAMYLTPAQYDVSSTSEYTFDIIIRSLVNRKQNRGT